MEISEQEAQERINNPNNLAVRVEYVRPHNGSRNGNSPNAGKAIPPLIRELIAVAAHHDTIPAVAHEFGVSESTVQQAKKGNIGVNRHDPELREKIDGHIKKRDESIRETALDRLAGMFASVITPENLERLKDPAKAVAVAKDIASIAEKVQDKRGSGSIID